MQKDSSAILIPLFGDKLSGDFQYGIQRAQNCVAQYKIIDRRDMEKITIDINDYVLLYTQSK